MFDNETGSNNLPPLAAQPVGAPPPFVWSAHDAAEQAHQLDLLAGWVTWLVRRYSLDQRTVPPCWREHGEFIEELAALQLAWQAAFARLAHGDAPLQWHEHFSLARVRFADAVARSGCRPREHRGPSSPVERGSPERAVALPQRTDEC